MSESPGAIGIDVVKSRVLEPFARVREWFSRMNATLDEWFLAYAVISPSRANVISDYNYSPKVAFRRTDPDTLRKRVVENLNRVLVRSYGPRANQVQVQSTMPDVTEEEAIHIVATRLERWIMRYGEKCYMGETDIIGREVPVMDMALHFRDGDSPQFRQCVLRRVLERNGRIKIRGFDADS